MTNIVEQTMQAVRALDEHPFDREYRLNPGKMMVSCHWPSGVFCGHIIEDNGLHPHHGMHTYDVRRFDGRVTKCVFATELERMSVTGSALVAMIRTMNRVKV